MVSSYIEKLWWKLPGIKRIDKIEIFVVAIHKETIENYTQIVKEAGLKPSFFEIEIFLISKSFSLNTSSSFLKEKLYLFKKGEFFKVRNFWRDLLCWSCSINFASSKSTFLEKEKIRSFSRPINFFTFIEFTLSKEIDFTGK